MAFVYKEISHTSDEFLHYFMDDPDFRYPNLTPVALTVGVQDVTYHNTTPTPPLGGALLCHILDPASHGMNSSVEMLWATHSSQICHDVYWG